MDDDRGKSYELGQSAVKCFRNIILWIILGTLPLHGVGTIFDRVLTELVSKTKEMKIDLAEMGCLRAIIFFNPGKITHFYYLWPIMPILNNFKMSTDAKGRKSIYRRWKP